MAKSARASSRKNNNQRLKKSVFGPAEAARTERLSAKLMDLVAQQAPAPVPAAAKEEEGAAAHAMEDTAEAHEPTPGDQLKEEASAMDVDAEARPAKKTMTRKRIEKRRSKKGSILFPKFKERSEKRRK